MYTPLEGFAFYLCVFTFSYFTWQRRTVLLTLPTGGARCGWCVSLIYVRRLLQDASCFMHIMHTFIYCSLSVCLCWTSKVRFDFLNTTVDLY